MANPPPAPSPAAPPNDGETADSSVSWFHKTVTLRDWWLIKTEREAQGKGLAVAGYSFSENKARRFIKSGPIAKRFDVFTLETEDRIVVILQGFVNEARTIESGFSPEVIDRFFFGFPFCWEEYAVDCSEEVICPRADANHARDASGLNESAIDPDDACPTFTSTEGKDTDQDVMVATVDDLNDSTPDPSVRDGGILDHGSGIGGQELLKNVDFPQLTSCHSNAMNLAKETASLPTEPSSNIVGESSHKTVHHITRSKRKRSSDQQSNIKQSADARGVAVCDSLLDRHVSLRTCAIHDLNIPDAENMTPIGISRGTDVRETREVNKKNGDGMKSGSSLPRDSKSVMNQKDDILGSPSIGNTYILEQMGQSKKDVMTVDDTDSGIEVGMSCLSNVEGDKSVTTDPNSGKRKCAKDLKDGKIQKCHLRSRPAGKSNTIQQNAVDLNDIPVVIELPASADAKVTPSKVVKGHVLRNLKDGKTRHSSSKVYVNRKEKKSLSVPKKHLSYGKHKRDSSTSLSSPTELNLGEAMLRAGRTLHSPPTHTKIQDKNGQAASKKRGSSRKKAERKIESDLDVTPKNHGREKKTCILSADSLTLKRSRAGRLLLPTLHFWRNQIPVYDAERNITGIREEVDA